MENTQQKTAFDIYNESVSEHAARVESLKKIEKEIEKAEIVRAAVPRTDTAAWEAVARHRTQLQAFKKSELNRIAALEVVIANVNSGNVGDIFSGLRM